MSETIFDKVNAISQDADRVASMLKQLISDMNNAAVAPLDIGSVQNRLDDLENELGDVKSRLSSFGDMDEESIDRALNEHAEGIQDLTDRLDRIPDLDDYDEFRSETNSKLERMAEQYDSLECDNSDLREVNADLLNKYNELKARLDSLLLVPT